MSYLDIARRRSFKVHWQRRASDGLRADLPTGAPSRAQRPIIEVHSGLLTVALESGSGMPLDARSRWKEVAQLLPQWS